MTILPNDGNKDGLIYKTLYNKEVVIGNCTVFPNAHFELHYHDMTEIYMIIEGVGEVFNNNKWNPVKKGDIIIFPAKTIHCCRTDRPEGIKLIYMFSKGPFESIKYYFAKELNKKAKL